MTAQTLETLTVGGAVWNMHDEPLSGHAALRQLPAHAALTSLWRGYWGEWAIADGRLLLTAVSVCHQDADGATPGLQRVPLADLFPGHADGPVAADWVSGTLLIERSEEKPSVGDVPRQAIEITLKGGRVVSSVLPMMVGRPSPSACAELAVRPSGWLYAPAALAAAVVAWQVATGAPLAADPGVPLIVGAAYAWTGLRHRAACTAAALAEAPRRAYARALGVRPRFGLAAALVAVAAVLALL